MAISKQESATQYSSFLSLPQEKPHFKLHNDAHDMMHYPK
jgi:hypothetical protein